MCGIAGFLGTGTRSDLQRMTNALAHRGPDAEGLYQVESEGLHLGHRRLSIVDLTCGAQPMHTVDGKFSIVFNGEIYNHAALRMELQQRGCVFQTDHSDTEVLLHGYREHGAAFVERLNGMWAFAIWDHARRELFISRDRFGKKPLYWFHHQGAFTFASELTALLEHPSSPRNESRLALQKFFAYALIPAPHSIIDGIWKLPAGHNLIVCPGEAPKISRYWRFELEPEESWNSRPEQDLAEELLALLDGAVARRLMSDVPLGVFLSGGIDSTAVAALACRHVDRGQLKTFSIGFSEPTFDESAFAKRAAGHLQTSHSLEMLDLDKAIEVLPLILDKLDEPQGDNSLLPTWLLSRFTRRHVTVALGGDGGDELFAGYETFRGLNKAQWYSRLVPKPVHHGIAALASLMPVSHNNLSFDFKIKRGLGGVQYPAPYWNAAWLGAVAPGELSRCFGGSVDLEAVYSEAIEVWDSCRQKTLLDRTLQFYTEIYMQDGILAKVDRASMMHGLEARSPFLDIEVADFARRLPNRFKLRDGVTKYLLKKALEPLLPADIIYRKKKGFGTPMSAWFHTGKLTITEPSHFAQARAVAHLNRKSDERLFLWCQYTAEQWRARRQRAGLIA